MSPSLSAELWRFLGLIALALLGAGLFGHLAWWLCAVVTFYLVWQLSQLLQLRHWLVRGRGHSPPDASGMWGDVFYAIYRMQRRHHQRKRRLSVVVDQFREATAALPDAIVVLDTDHRIQWFNAAASRLLGLRAMDVGYPLTNLVRHPALVSHLAGEGEQEAVEVPSPVNESWYLSVRVVTYGQDQRLVVARDVTRLHRLEVMRRDFIANVSHELRTPLTVLSGYLETLREDNDPDPEQWRHCLQLMEAQTDRMQRLVDDLLTLSRLETSDRTQGDTPVAVARLAQTIADEARALSGDKGHVIEVEADPELYLRGGEHELRSAFANLVFNAVQYTPAGGAIWIHWYRDEDGGHFTVQDAGEGIPAHHIPRLTERFYRVDVGKSRQSGGTGLGLAIVKHVLNRHGGTLEVDSVPGQGSLFRCDFPVERLVEQQELQTQAGETVTKM